MTARKILPKFGKPVGLLKQAISIGSETDGEHRSLPMKIQDEMSKQGSEGVQEAASDVQRAKGLKVPGGLGAKDFMNLLH